MPSQAPNSIETEAPTQKGQPVGMDSVFRRVRQLREAIESEPEECFGASIKAGRAYGVRDNLLCIVDLIEQAIAQQPADADTAAQGTDAVQQGEVDFEAWHDEYSKQNYSEEMLARAAWDAALAQKRAAVVPVVDEVVASLRNAALMYEDGSCARSNLTTAALLVEHIAAKQRASVDGALNELRANGWDVAVHNDYRLGGENHTFWLFTKNGRAVKGEGRTDAEALAQVKDEIARLADRSESPNHG